MVGEFRNYPALAQLQTSTDLACDVYVIDIDTDPHVALDLVEGLSVQDSSVTVMVSSTKDDPDVLVRTMRAGARELLRHDISAPIIAEALIRAAARRNEKARPKRTSGKVIVFWGAKGGVGVTTLASSFAVALRGESEREVVLVDFDVQLGDVSVSLGIKPKFTLQDALTDTRRLDRDFVSTLLSDHVSGVSVLSAADEYNPSRTVPTEGFDQLFRILRDEFPYVVVDAGPSLGASAEALMRVADMIYLVAQIDVPAVRNAQRMLAYMEGIGLQRVEVILNRFEARKVDIDDQLLTKALGLHPKWKVPNDFAAARRAQNTGKPLIQEKSAVSKVIIEMARAISGLAPVKEKRKAFGLFG
jgi:pilus assembly protein CpaE